MQTFCLTKVDGEQILVADINLFADESQTLDKYSYKTRDGSFARTERQRRHPLTAAGLVQRTEAGVLDEPYSAKPA
jgi:hypothetical protein